MASNEDWVCPATYDERRFFVLCPLETKQQDVKYFDAIIKEKENGGVEAMYYDLMRRDYSLANLRIAPKTDGLIEQVGHSLDDVLNFWRSALSRGFLLSNKETGGPEKAMAGTELYDWPERAFKYEVYNEFKQIFCRNKLHCISEQAFWQKTWTFWERGKTTQTRYSVDGSRKFQINLDSLDEMKKMFENLTKIKFPDNGVTDEEVPF